MDRVFRFFENYADENEHRRESNATRIKKVFKERGIFALRHDMSGIIVPVFFISDACQCICH